MQHGSGPAPGAVVGAVVTAFSAAESLLAACAGLAGQVDMVVVVDDGSPEPDLGLLERCTAGGALVVRHPVNRGIATALNTGIARLREELGVACTHVLTLDQDSVTPEGYVALLLAAEHRALAAGHRVAMTGPGQAGRVRSAARRGARGVVLSKEPIQSGLLVPLAALDVLGPFDEGLFIDGVDTDFFLRARARGMVAVAVPAARLEHSLGQVHPVGRDRAAQRLAGVMHAAPFRYYYIARNRVHLVRRHGRAAPGWAMGAVLRDLRHLAVVTLLVPGRWERLRSTAAGVRDGFRGVVGRRPTPRSSAP